MSFDFLLSCLPSLLSVLSSSSSCSSPIISFAIKTTLRRQFCFLTTKATIEQHGLSHVAQWSACVACVRLGGGGRVRQANQGK